MLFTFHLMLRSNSYIRIFNVIEKLLEYKVLHTSNEHNDSIFDAYMSIVERNWPVNSTCHSLITFYYWFSITSV